MVHWLRKIFRDFLTFSKAEQYGIVALIILIFVFTALYFALPSLIKVKQPDYSSEKKEIEAFLSLQKKIKDSVNIERIQSSGQLTEELAKNKLNPFPFDPNKLPSNVWKQLGLTDKQIKVIKNYEAKGGKFYVKEDLKKLYCISEAEYKILEPYIIIKPLYFPGKVEIIDETKKPKYKLTELNSADSATFVKNLRMPGWMAARIIKYRIKLGGFYDKNQLLEVYGMKKKYYNPIKKYVYADTSLLRKICINQVGFKQLLRHPYCDYNTVKQIFTEKRKLGNFSNLNQVLNLISVDSVKNKLSHYLYICPPDIRDN